MIESALYSYLMSVSALIALIGNRLYPAVAPSPVAKPYCVYNKVSSGREYAHDGYAYEQPLIQVSVFAATYANAKAVKYQLIKALEAWQYHTEINGEIDQYESDTNLYHVAIDCVVFYKEE